MQAAAKSAARTLALERPTTGPTAPMRAGEHATHSFLGGHGRPLASTCCLVNAPSTPPLPTRAFAVASNVSTSIQSSLSCSPTTRVYSIPRFDTFPIAYSAITNSPTVPDDRTTSFARTPCTSSTHHPS
ncbi:hypothetical protein BCR44DRAFT_33564 [Catenaria anguillulae PL171]|uniref:Uncharacterized protein n=1 Tax=Catenaria anguillulae PL171 TaxID=765915 RepID=A0A1Y2HJG6_9FUNG|nr:hypothetical protein BCR44DRAFT_33564 [Catenaria anguillulae PL171]